MEAITSEEVKAANRRAQEVRQRQEQAAKDAEQERLAKQYTAKLKRGYAIAKQRADADVDERMHLVNEIAHAEMTIKKYTLALERLNAKLPLVQSAFDASQAELRKVEAALKAIGETV